MTASYLSPIEFLNFAEKLLDSERCSNNEACIRTVMNRCYYAVFLSLRDKLNLPENTTHKTVYNQIKKKDGVSAGYLDFLWTHRIASDYHLRSIVKLRGWRGVKFIVSFHKDKAWRCIITAKRAIERLQKIP